MTGIAAASSASTIIQQTDWNVSKTGNIDRENEKK
jgi:hypothetical protein